MVKERRPGTNQGICSQRMNGECMCRTRFQRESLLLSLSHNISAEPTKNIYLKKKIGKKSRTSLLFYIEEKLLIVTKALLRNFNTCVSIHLSALDVLFDQSSTILCVTHEVSQDRAPVHHRSLS